MRIGVKVGFEDVSLLEAVSNGVQICSALWDVRFEHNYSIDYR